MIVEARGKQFEGYAMTKKEAKEKAAEEALKYLYNIISLKGLHGFHCVVFHLIFS